MKKIFTLLVVFFTTAISFAQTCTTTGFEVCTPGTAVSSDFKNAVQIAGTGNPLTAGAKYKFNYAVPLLNLDAVITIDAIVNAKIIPAGNSNSIDDDGVVNETNAASQASLFSPRIAPDQALSCTNRSGYIEFSVKFYTHYTGNGTPITGTEMAVANLNFLNFDMDGFTTGNDGWYKEIGYVKVNGLDPVNFSAPATALVNAGNDNGWLLTYGSAAERAGVARCNEVTEKSVFIDPQTAISFRLGYDYKAPSANCNDSKLQPVRDYGVRFGCFNLPAAGPLPVSLVNFGANYTSEKVDITWTSLQEHNLDSYEIQRSFDGVNFEVAGNVKANNLTSLQQYKLTDNIAAFNAKYIYYRIRIADLDHSMKLTNTVLIKVTDLQNNEMSISPNPSSTNAQIKVKATSAGLGDITVFDASGKLILKQQAAVVVGNNAIIINNITTLSEGYYTIRLVTKGETFSSKLLIWK